MDAHDSVRTKVDAIFRELVGDRAETLRADKPARHANDILGQVLASEREMDPLKADELAFHLVDWNAEAAFLVSAILFPERFTPAELEAGVEACLIHIPAHVMAAARLGGYEAKDTFADENAI
jgi:hypothetical protein